MNEATLLVYQTFVALTILVVCLAGFGVVIFWTLPNAMRAWSRRRDDSPEGVYAKWQLLRTVLYAYQLATLLAVAVAFLAMTDVVLRAAVNTTLLLGVILALCATVLTEPVARRRVETAIDHRMRSDATLGRLEGKQDRDLEISRRTETGMGEILDEQKRVRKEKRDELLDPTDD